jgi:mannosylglycerate hydrolase
MSKRTMHVISHTHWDREWYQDFQGYRRRLVHQVEALLDLLERRPDFHSFLMDGQTAWIDDFLEMRPDQRDRLAGHLRSGRISIGPWFVMPDELLLSGESLVRNLDLGHRICASFGVAPLPVGYVTDIFGHCSQLPQILRGFGIGCVMLHRGTSGTDEASEMVWEGADGSAVLLIKVYPHTGYNDFLTIRWENWDDTTLRDYEKKKQQLATTPVLFALDGNDHEPAREDTLDLIGRVNRVFEDTVAVHSSLTDYLAALRDALGPDWQTGRRRFKGELRTPSRAGSWNDVMTGTASSRVPLKQANDAVEWLLARGVEPLCAWVRLLGGGSDQTAFLDLAWRYLLLNHPHDSIVGCSIDQVHRDMGYRFDQARLIGEGLAGECLIELGDRMDCGSFGAEACAVSVFNLSTIETGPFTRFNIEIEAERVAREESAGKRLALFDEEGQAVPFSVVAKEPSVRAWPLTRKEPGWYRCRPYKPQTRWQVAAELAVPGLGYRTLKADFVPNAERVADPRPRVKVDAAARTLTNGRVTLSVGEDGRVELLDHATGVAYPGLHVFEDCGDAGDGWNHVFPEQDKVVLGTDSKARGPVSVTAGREGPLAGFLEVRFTLRVPADAEAIPKKTGALRRTRRSATLSICTRFTLLAGERRIECRTTIHNTARRHRVRVLFPTHRAADHWYGDTAFDVVVRPTALPDTRGWKEQARAEAPVKNMAAIQDDRGGLAVLTHGLQEACVKDDGDRTLALTLFRGFVQTLYFTPSEDSLQQGDVISDYALVPLGPQGEALSATLMGDVDRYKAPVFSYSRPAASGHGLPLSGRLIEVPPPLVLTAIKPGRQAGSLILRCFNPLNQAIVAVLRPAFEVVSAWQTDLLERPGEMISCKEGSITVAWGPKQVLTLQLNSKCEIPLT